MLDDLRHFRAADEPKPGVIAFLDNAVSLAALLALFVCAALAYGLA